MRRVLQRPGRQRKRSSAKSSCGPSRTSSSAPSLSPPLLQRAVRSAAVGDAASALVRHLPRRMRSDGLETVNVRTSRGTTVPVTTPDYREKHARGAKPEAGTLPRLGGAGHLRPVHAEAGLRCKPRGRHAQLAGRSAGAAPLRRHRPGCQDPRSTAYRKVFDITFQAEGQVRPVRLADLVGPDHPSDRWRHHGPWRRQRPDPAAPDRPYQVVSYRFRGATGVPRCSRARRRRGGPEAGRRAGHAGRPRRVQAGLEVLRVGDAGRAAAARGSVPATSSSSRFWWRAATRARR